MPQKHHPTEVIIIFYDDWRHYPEVVWDSEKNMFLKVAGGITDHLSSLLCFCPHFIKV